MGRKTLENMTGLIVGFGSSLFYNYQMQDVLDKTGIYDSGDLGAYMLKASTVILGGVALLFGGMKIGNYLGEKLSDLEINF